jgi:hypothetical protein
MHNLREVNRRLAVIRSRTYELMELSRNIIEEAMGVNPETAAVTSAGRPVACLFDEVTEHIEATEAFLDVLQSRLMVMHGMFFENDGPKNPGAGNSLHTGKLGFGPTEAAAEAAMYRSR